MVELSASVGLAPRTITVTPEVVPYWQDRRRPLRDWLTFFALVAFFLALLAYPVWGFVEFNLAIGLSLVAIAAWVHFTFPRGRSATASGETGRFGISRPARRWIVALVAIGIAIVLMGLATFPMAHSYSATIPPAFYHTSDRGWELKFPGADLVSVVWGTSSNQSVLVTMTSASTGSVVYQGNGTGDSFEFTQSDVWVVVQAPANATATVTIDGTYWSPYWVVSF